MNWCAVVRGLPKPNSLQRFTTRGVVTMTGIKYRTRAMMGGCQGGFCQMKIEQMIEQELGCRPQEVCYSRKGSWVLTGNMRGEA